MQLAITVHETIATALIIKHFEQFEKTLDIRVGLVFHLFNGEICNRHQFSAKKSTNWSVKCSKFLVQWKS